MKRQTIQEMSTEALLKRKKTTEFVTGVLIGLLIVLLSSAIFVYVKKDSAVGLPLLIIPLALSPIVFISFNDVRAVKKELQTRNQRL